MSINNDSQHSKNERVHASRGPNSIMEMVVNGRKVEKKRKEKHSICGNFPFAKIWQARD
jgi:hypothetical protein